jgi:probable addiction module antidote protein
MNMYTKPYQPDLLARLANPEYAALYLKASLDETLSDGDFEAFLLALKNVVEAQDSIAQVAQQAQVSRQHLYKLLSGQGNPTLETLLAVLQAVGLSLDFRPMGDPSVLS